MKCSNCGKEIPKDEKVCPKCGCSSLSESKDRERIYD